MRQVHWTRNAAALLLAAGLLTGVALPAGNPTAEAGEWPEKTTVDDRGRKRQDALPHQGSRRSDGCRRVVFLRILHRPQHEYDVD